MRILVVDDNAELLAEIEQYLVDAGHQVRSAENAEDALQVVETDREYDVVVTDISMPGMNGVEMWDKMIPLLPAAKVIFISSANNSFLRRYLPGPLLAKPFRLAELHDCIAGIRSKAA